MKNCCRCLPCWLHAMVPMADGPRYLPRDTKPYRIRSWVPGKHGARELHACEQLHPESSLGCGSRRIMDYYIAWAVGEPGPGETRVIGGASGSSCGLLCGRFSQCCDARWPSDSGKTKKGEERRRKIHNSPFYHIAPETLVGAWTIQSNLEIFGFVPTLAFLVYCQLLG